MPDDQSQDTISLADLDQAPTELPHPVGDIPYDQHEKLRQAFIELTVKCDDLTLMIETKNNDHEAASILNKLIEPFSHKIYDFMCVYCAVVATFLAVNFILKIPDKVLEFMVGSTAVTVFGLIGTVLTGIFVGARPKK